MAAKLRVLFEGQLSSKTCEFPFDYGFHFSLIKSGVKIKPVKI
jgi:hypothetical protein